MGMNQRLLRPILSGDPDALRYIAAVQAADQQSLEPAVRKAVNDFVVGCKQDGIWSAIKASCILMGANTLPGALVPLVGPAPTSNGFDGTTDYSRKTGLVGNGSTKSIGTNRAQNADAQDNFHMSVYVHTPASSTGYYIGGLFGTGWNVIRRNTPVGFNGVSLAAQTLSTQSNRSGASIDGFIGVARIDPSIQRDRLSGTDFTASSNSGAPTSANYRVFSNQNGSEVSDARIAFYSVGSDLTLALLDARVSALYAAIGAAIP